MKLIALSVVFIFALSAFAQEEDRELTPEEIIKLMDEISKLMGEAEEALHYSSLEEAEQASKEIIKRILELIRIKDKKQQKELMKDIFKRVRKLLEKSWRAQGKAIDKINEILRRAPQCEGDTQQQRKDKDERKKPKRKPKRKPGKSGSTRQPGSPARQPYDPAATDPPNPFKALKMKALRWGELPPKIREIIEQGIRGIDKFPPEYQEILKKYYEKLAKPPR